MATNNYPKLHNAMWPGVVGKGSGDGEPIIPLDTLLELTANAEVDGQKFDGVDLWLADPHISIDSRQRTTSSSCRDHIASFGLKVGSFVAPIWGGAGGGSAMGDRRTTASASSTQVSKACAIGKQMRDIGIRPTGGIRDRFLDRRRGLGQGPGGQHQEDRRDLPRGGKIAAGPRRVPRRRGRDLLGRHAFLAREREPARDGRHAGRRRLPGRHGAFDALHARRQRREGPPPARRTTTGRTRPRSTPPTRRSPTRCGRGRSISTSRRTTARSSAPATTRRPAATARSTIRTASSISPSTPATGCATTRATSPRRCATSAGTAACSRTR